MMAGGIAPSSLTTGLQDATLDPMATKNKAAVALGKRRAATAADGELSELGRKGGSRGGPARAKALSKARRQEIARAAAKARWGAK